MAGERILIVDDEPAVRRAIAKALHTVDYSCAEAGSVPEARDALGENGFDLVICDMKMPGESGLVLVKELEAAAAEVAVLMVTVVDSPDVAHTTTMLGANGYLCKPFTVNELLINVDHALQDSRRREESALAEREQERRVKEVRDAILLLEQEALAADRHAAELLRPLSEAVGRRDLETGAHIRRVGESSAMLAEAYGMSEEDVEAIRLASPMHDVGKVAIPDSVLLKKGGLDPGERVLVERHAPVGYDILSGSTSPLMELAAEIALTHHEKVNGSGYPKGLKGDEIPIAGRIVAVADVYDALTSDRPYRQAIPAAEAVEMMVAERGTHFDPNLLDLFLERLDDVQALQRRFADRASGVVAGTS